MLPLHLLWPFLLATLVFTAMPGPAMLYTAAQTLAHGRRAGFFTALGIHVGGYGYVLATALGLSAMLHYVPAVYLAVKLAGAGYLMFLGLGVLRGGAAKASPPKPAKNSFRGGLAVELLNPKTAIFFVAFLPQFVEIGGIVPVQLQLLLLGVFVNCAFSSADFLGVLLAHRLRAGIGQGGWGQQAMRWLSGSVLIGLGARLAVGRG